MTTQKITYTLAETESTLSQTADDRTIWRMYTADPVIIRKMESIGAKLLRNYDDYQGRLYEVKAEQIIFRKGKRVLSEKQLKARRSAIKKAQESNAAKAWGSDENDEISTDG